MAEPKYAFHRAYVSEELWSKERAEEHGYIRVPEDLINKARHTIYFLGAKIKILNPKNKEITGLQQNYLFKGKFVRVNPFPKAKPVPLCGPDMELHSETKLGLAKLMDSLGFK